MTSHILTQIKIKSLFFYNENTGDLVRKSTGKSVKSKDRKGYYRTGISGKRYYVHRIAFIYMTGFMPEDQVDHINHDHTDNRWANLRSVSNQENHKNKPLGKRNKSGAVGVWWESKRNKWYTNIVVDGKSKYIGRFDSKYDAIIARKAAEKKYGFHENHGAIL